MRPSFLITIDTEGDDQWSRPRVAATRNAAFLERFQELCERFGLRPTWLTTHEMVGSPTFREFAADVLARGTAEIGMHLHAWDSPPLVPLTDDDLTWHPYLVEYPADVLREKVHALTARLEDTLGVKMTSHRAGRWAFDGRYAEALLDEGYLVDCSVTPLVSWRASPGAPQGNGGTDYRRFPSEPYRLDLADIASPAASGLLEVPMTILPRWPAALSRAFDAVEGMRAARLSRRALNRVRREVAWLRPDGRNRAELLEVVQRVLAGERSYAEFMLHSSELMPGGSPTFRDAESIERLYEDLHALFAAVGPGFRGETLSEFARRVASG